MSRLAGMALKAVLTATFLIYIILNSYSHAHIYRFADGGGGRFPTSDSYAWVMGSNQAVTERKSGAVYAMYWVSRRPLNVSFNIPVFRLSSSLPTSDPIATALLIKRILAIASIGLLTLNLSKIINPLSNFLLATSLASILFYDPKSTSLLNSYFAVGFSSLTTLNAFIFVVTAAAVLIPALTDYQADKQSKNNLLARLIPGLIILSLATLMRPGTLLLNPMMYIFIMYLILERISNTPNKREKNNGNNVKRVMLTAMFIAFICFGSAFTLQFLSLQGIKHFGVSANYPTAKCGAISGNSGYVAYGISLNKDWTAGSEYVAQLLSTPQGLDKYIFSDEKGKPVTTCESKINSEMYRQALINFLKQPINPLKVIANNSKQLFKQAFNLDPSHGLFSTKANERFRLLSYVGTLSIFLLPSARKVARNNFLPNGPLFVVFSFALIGYVSMTLFQLLFLQEAFIRPSIPYAVFPLLLLSLLVEIYIICLKKYSPAKLLLEGVNESQSKNILKTNTRAWSLSVTFSLMLTFIVVLGVAATYLPFSIYSKSELSQYIIAEQIIPEKTEIKTAMLDFINSFPDNIVVNNKQEDIDSPRCVMSKKPRIITGTFQEYGDRQYAEFQLSNMPCETE